MRRLFPAAFFSALVFSVPPALAASSSAAATSSNSAADTPVTSPLILQIRVLDGEGANYIAGSRAVRGITVEVTDETGKAVSNAAISFRLPEDGPTGLFPNGTRTEIASTSPEGRATVWGMKWNRLPGQFSIRITAAKGETRAGAIVIQNLVEPSTAAAAAISGKQDQIGGKTYKLRRSKRWIWITATAAAVAGGGLVLGTRQTGTSASGPGAVPGLSIGNPSILLGGGK